MLIDVNSELFGRSFPSNPHPFISDLFILLNKDKAERIVRLIEDCNKPGIGLIAGIKEGIIHSPFSAPFGGFHYRKENMYISEIDNYISSLQDYIIFNKLHGITITLPPDIYHLTFNAKVSNSLIRKNFQTRIPEITNWVNLDLFNGSFSQRNSREYYRQALRNGLSFEKITTESEKKAAYDLICENRAKFGRPIFMTYEDVIDTSKLWPVDFFKVNSDDQKLVASAIFYRYSEEIIYALFWGDNETGRPLRAMDFLAYNLWSYYADMGCKFIDLGISTESGNPNEGLLRFKETHESISSLRYSFYWQND